MTDYNDNHTNSNIDTSHRNRWKIETILVINFFIKLHIFGAITIICNNDEVANNGIDKLDKGNCIIFEDDKINVTKTNTNLSITTHISIKLDNISFILVILIDWLKRVESDDINDKHGHIDIDR